MSAVPIIQIIRHTSLLNDAQVLAAVYVIQHQMTYHFAPYWGQHVHLKMVPPGGLDPAHWSIALLDNSDQAGALGYHDLSSGGIPIGNVFVKTDQEYGLSWTVTLSHEILEMAADPDCSRAYQTNDFEFTALEVGDPVEGDQFGYHIDNVLVSDFILPSWFTGAKRRFDFAAHTSEHLQVLADGYVSKYIVLGGSPGWQQFQRQAAGMVEIPLEAGNPRFRHRGVCDDQGRVIQKARGTPAANVAAGNS